MKSNIDSIQKHINQTKSNIDSINYYVTKNNKNVDLINKNVEYIMRSKNTNTIIYENKKDSITEKLDKIFDQLNDISNELPTIKIE